VVEIRSRLFVLALDAVEVISINGRIDVADVIVGTIESRAGLSLPQPCFDRP
jgi:hypothetical protein